jgi:aerobic carbon-monoxide dehydrogenase small subunit
MTATRRISLTVNGTDVIHDVEPRLNLADFLRGACGLSGTHVGCEHGVCGACTVLVDGEAVRSCLMLAVQADQTNVVTVEGLTENGRLSRLQEAMRRHHGLQCGFCTPGVLATLTYFLARHPHPTRNDVRAALTGNLCRCTGYKGIIDAVMDVTSPASPAGG